MCHRGSLGIYLNIALTTERTQIVEAACVVVVMVCQQHCINLVERLMKHLYSEIGATIDEQPAVAMLDKSRRA
jgi:hypothetical protein